MPWKTATTCAAPAARMDAVEEPAPPADGADWEPVGGGLDALPDPDAMMGSDAKVWRRWTVWRRFDPLLPD